jgi:hypothetical protein
MIPAKVAIIEKIGESGVLLPELINRGLAASDRLKYFLQLLQAAYTHALAPTEPLPNLRIQREASGLDDVQLDRVIEGSVDRGSGTVYVPGSCAIVATMFEESRRMLQPLLVAGAARSDLRTRTEIYQRRLDDLFAHAPVCADDLLTKSTIKTLTKLSENGHDTMHQLVIDLHWELNRVQASVTMETVDGARVYSLLEGERALVRAFMKGINETASLKFDRPGLATTAAHEGDRLTIQNDLGLTKAHVILVHVAELSVTLTYADMHRPRWQFLQELLQPYAVQWTPPEMPAGEDYEIAVGHYTAGTPEQLERFLRFLGSRLVFLIEWNRARKRLTQLVSKTDALALLKWAAENNVGHMGFLKAGDTQLIETAVERAFSHEMRPVARLDKWLGADAARSFLMSVLRTTSSGMSAGHSLSLIEDEIEADLLRYLQTSDRQMLADAADHASMISALDDHVRRTLTRLKAGDGHDEASRTAELALTWTVKADQIVRHAGRWLHASNNDQQLRVLLGEADSAVAALEETAFLLTLVPPATDAKMLSLLAGLAHLVGGAVRQYMDCLEESRDLSTVSVRSDVESFLVTVDRLVDLGRQAHTAKRTLTEKLLRGPGDFHELFVVASLAHEFERAATALSRCGPIVRDYVLKTRLSR